jgi:hypothetical protein
MVVLTIADVSHIISQYEVKEKRSIAISKYMISLTSMLIPESLKPGYQYEAEVESRYPVV